MVPVCILAHISDSYNETDTMQVCDSCGCILEFLQDTSIYIGLKNGDWAAINAELCPDAKIN